MKFAVVTPVRNAESLIEQTVQSIVQQDGVETGEFELDYLIWDGASTDSTAELAQDVAGKFARVVSRKDAGMYDGLARAFAQVDGDIYFYLNAGDLLMPGALRLVAQLHEQGQFDWICGMNVHYAANGSIVRADLPFRYKQKWIRLGLYGTVLPHIQQESSFWSSRLMARLDLERLASYKLAGDFYIWHTFARFSEPRIVQAVLGGFRHHGEHLSGDSSLYSQEMREIVGRGLTPLRILEAFPAKIIWHMPMRVKSSLNPGIVRYSPSDDKWLT
jgi:glycosyltransferase involved in cell wall biosynthesis